MYLTIKPMYVLILIIIIVIEERIYYEGEERLSVLLPS